MHGSKSQKVHHGRDKAIMDPVQYTNAELNYRTEFIIQQLIR